MPALPAVCLALAAAGFAGNGAAAGHGSKVRHRHFGCRSDFALGILAATVYYEKGNLNIKYALVIAMGLVIDNLFEALFANQPYISSETMKQLYGIFLLALLARY